MQRQRFQLWIYFHVHLIKALCPRDVLQVFDAFLNELGDVCDLCQDFSVSSPVNKSLKVVVDGIN